MCEMKKTTILLIAVVTLTACGSNKIAAQPEVSETNTLEITTPPIVNGVVVECEMEQPENVNSPNSEPIELEVIIKEPIPEIIEIFNHQAFDALLKSNVSNDGVVNYAGFMKSKSELRAYISSLGLNMPAENWNQEDNLAFWMNAYNAMTVDLILRNYPLESIKDIDKPWNQRLWKLSDKWYNLDDIEHQILRKMNDPRIHFGINCASFSCPPLLNEAFTSKKVDSQLDELSRKFINDTRRNSISENEVWVSKIFKWFAKDFKRNESLIDFLNKYSNIPISPKAKLRYQDYNWDLND